MGSWKGLKTVAGEFRSLGVRVIGLASDTEAQLRDFRTDHDLPFEMLSDPMLITGEALDEPISSKKGYLGALSLHPVIRHLPKKAFLQPAFFVWSAGSCATSGARRRSCETSSAPPAGLLPSRSLRSLAM